MVKELLTKGEQTRARIVDAAYALFISQGYAATSMRAIAEASGLALGGLYAHFKSKEAIWEEVFKAKHPYHEILPMFLNAQGKTFEEVIRDAVYNTVKELGKRDDLYNLMFIELVEFDGKHISVLAGIILPIMPQLAVKFFGLNASLRPISPSSFVRSLSGLILMYHLTERLMPPVVRHLASPHALDEMIDTFLYGVLADDAPSRRNHA